MISVKKRNNESEQQMVRRFKRKVARSGVLKAVRQKRWFISESEKRRIALKKAKRRAAKKRRKRR
jgi:small subunit ribosomal protein S21